MSIFSQSLLSRCKNRISSFRHKTKTLTMWRKQSQHSLLYSLIWFFREVYYILCVNHCVQDRRYRVKTVTQPFYILISSDLNNAADAPDTIHLLLLLHWWTNRISISNLVSCRWEKVHFSAMGFILAQLNNAIVNV